MVSRLTAVDQELKLAGEAKEKLGLETSEVHRRASGL
jgi:hypothetical protein